MFLDFYGLREQPFGVTPDPAYLYPSRTHCEALDSLTEAILGDRGFLALIAEPGMGKTTLLHQVLEGLRENARSVFLFQTQCNSREFFEYLMNELGVDSTGMGIVAMHNRLNEILFAEMLAGRRFVLIIDEAQNLDESVLETVRLLSNFETPHAKLMQIVLAGQPQLSQKLEKKELAQLLQRITMIKFLETLTPAETAGYIRHRLKVAGYSGKPLFEPDALLLIAERSQGIPRNINKICFRTLMEGYAAGAETLSSDLVEQAVSSLQTVNVSRPKLIAMPAPRGRVSAAGPNQNGQCGASLATNKQPPCSQIQLRADFFEAPAPMGNVDRFVDPCSADSRLRITYKGRQANYPKNAAGRDDRPRRKRRNSVERKKSLLFHSEQIRPLSQKRTGECRTLRPLPSRTMVMMPKLWFCWIAPCNMNPPGSVRPIGSILICIIHV